MVLPSLQLSSPRARPLRQARRAAPYYGGGKARPAYPRYAFSRTSPPLLKGTTGVNAYRWDMRSLFICSRASCLAQTQTMNLG